MSDSSNETGRIANQGPNGTSGSVLVGAGRGTRTAIFILSKAMVYGELREAAAKLVGSFWHAPGSPRYAT